MTKRALQSHVGGGMRRINVLGNTGSGKSTLGRMIGARMGIPVVHLDRLYWEPGWRASEAGVFRQRVAEAIGGDAWVCEGNYAAQTFDLRVPRADLNVWLETPRAICAMRVILRSAGVWSRPDLPTGCEEGRLGNTIDLVRDAWRFDAVRRDRIESDLSRLARPEAVLRLGRHRIAAFLAGL